MNNSWDTLIWDKADARISNDELAELNYWAQGHQYRCKKMRDILTGNGKVQYFIEASSNTSKTVILTGIQCECGERYYISRESDKKYPYEDENGYTFYSSECWDDEVGGHHDCAEGWNPQGHWCGECCKASCVDCPARFAEKEEWEKR